MREDGAKSRQSTMAITKEEKNNNKDKKKRGKEGK
jgi:hypothetical protein